METVLLAVDSIYSLTFVAATVLAALQTQRDIRLARALVIVGATLMAVRWGVWALTTEAEWMTRGVVGALIGATLFILVPGTIHWLSERIKSEDAITAPGKPSRPITPHAEANVKPSEASSQKLESAGTEPKPTPQPSGIRKYIVEGLTKAREDLLGIKKENLSCDALSAWQTRSDTATRLAGAAIHNPIAQNLGVCKNNITDVEFLDAIRERIVQLLNEGIQSAGG